MPLEVFVERTRLEVATNRADGGTEPQLDLQMQVRLGLQFRREMDLMLSEILVDTNELRKYERFLAQDPDLSFELNEEQDKFEVEVTKKFVSIIKGRVINVYRATPSLDSPIILMRKTQEYFEDNPSTDPSVPEAVERAMQLALDNLKNWWYGNKEQTNVINRKESFFEMRPEDFSVWNPRQLEYDFKVQITPKDDSGTLLGKLVLDASGYQEDHLEWYSFTVTDESTVDLELPLEIESENPIATRLKFVGMPEKRWWNFEDRYMDFGSINPKKNNIASILVMEFALVYSPDWFIIPCKMSVGSINKIDKLSVKDCFGDETQIEPAGTG